MGKESLNMNDYSTFVSLIHCSIPGHSWQLEDSLHLYAHLHSSATEEDPVERFFKGCDAFTSTFTIHHFIKSGQIWHFYYHLFQVIDFLCRHTFLLKLRDEKIRLNQKCSRSGCR